MNTNRSRGLGVSVIAATLLASAGWLAGPAVASPLTPSSAAKVGATSDSRPQPFLAHFRDAQKVVGSTKADPTAPAFFNVGGFQFIATDGTRAVLTVAKPSLDQRDIETSAGIQTATADEQHGIYFGWRVNRALGDTKPHLFAVTIIDGASTCYDACSGFVSTNSTDVLGEALSLGLHKFAVQHLVDRWWVSLDDKRIGFYPDSHWGNRFTSAGLDLWGGQVETSESAPCSDLGNGLPAASPGAATARDIGYFHGEVVDFDNHAPNPDLYSIQAVSSTQLRFGGPGAC